MRPIRFILALSLLTLPLAVGCSGMKPGDLHAVRPETDARRAGSVYLLRGWIGIFSTGIDSLGDKLNAHGIHAEVFQEAQWQTLANTIVREYRKTDVHEPIVLIGHSYGADDAILIARELNAHGIKVDLVVTLDPVTPRKVPGNIDLVYNLYQSNGAFDNLPFLRGIPLAADEPGPRVLRNMDIRTNRTDLLYPDLDHFNIEKKAKILDDVIRQVLAVCPPREIWLAEQSRLNQLAGRNDAAIDPGGTR